VCITYIHVFVFELLAFLFIRFGVYSSDCKPIGEVYRRYIYICIFFVYNNFFNPVIKKLCEYSV
jgi:hypothetical protein